MQPPKRKYILEISIGGDELKDVINTLKTIIFDLNSSHIKEKNHSAISGGYNSNYFFDLAYNKDQTGDNYRKELEEYLKHKND